MNLQEPTSGRILIHGKGSGSAGPREIERRARELADIDGRPGNEPTDQDLARAEAELLGRNLPETNSDDEDARGTISRDPSEPISIPGHETPVREGPDEEKAVERLALEGVDEAQHEQMLASRRQDRRTKE